mgnify:FL=1
MSGIDRVTTMVGARLLGLNNAAQNAALEKLATGVRINRGKDDPAGLISSENLRAALAQLEAETKLARRADHVASIAEGALSEVDGMLVRAEGLAVRAANTAGMSDAEREALQVEMDSIVQTVDRIGRTTEFNGDRLLDGTARISFEGETLDFPETLATAMGPAGDEQPRLSDVTSGGSASLLSGDLATTQAVISAARESVSVARGSIGAFQANIIQPSLQNTMVAIENTAAAESQIRDTDYAKETANLIRAQTLGAASTSSLVAAGRSNRSVLDLLGG